jgi:alpha-mannosidase
MNQFHDILTGTSIGQVFEDAAKDYARIEEIAGSVLQAAGAALLPEGAEWLVLDGAQLPGVRYVTLPEGGPCGNAAATRCRAGGADGVLVELPERPPLRPRAGGSAVPGAR